jgi:hypothetical protein
MGPLGMDLKGGAMPEARVPTAAALHPRSGEGLGGTLQKREVGDAYHWYLDGTRRAMPWTRQLPSRIGGSAFRALLAILRPPHNR